MWPFSLSTIAALLATAHAIERVVVHDASFVPDVVLRISLATIQQNCQPRLSVVVNGTYPGPPVYLQPDTTTWVRVYNDADVNSTIVCLSEDSSVPVLIWVLALAWSYTSCLTFCRRYTSSIAMAYTSWSLLRLRTPSRCFRSWHILLPLTCWLSSYYCFRPSGR